MDKRKIRRQLRVLFKDIKKRMDAGEKLYPLTAHSECHTCVIVLCTLGDTAMRYYCMLLVQQCGSTYGAVPFGAMALSSQGISIAGMNTLQNPLRTAWINKLARRVPKI